MQSLDQLETTIQDLVNTAKDLIQHSREIDLVLGSAPHVRARDVDRDRRKVLAIATQIQTLLTSPNDLIRRLAVHNQLLACLQWLGEFQVLACIPLVGSVAARDVADLAGVPEGQLLRIVRMTATAGFLKESQPGFLAHTSLSAPFVTKLVYLDAAMFLAQTAAPAASMMTAATKRSQQDHGEETALNLALGTPGTRETFQSMRRNKPKLQRQWLAHLQCQADPDGCIVELLAQLDWQSLQNAYVVDVSAKSLALAQAFAERYPSVHFIVQVDQQAHQMLEQGKAQRRGSSFGISDIDSRITLQTRSPGSLQTVKGAAAYVLNMASCSTKSKLRSWILTELEAHLAMLRSNDSVMVLVAPHLIPEAGSTQADVEAAARAHNLLLLQFANEQETEVTELISLIKPAEGAQRQPAIGYKLQLIGKQGQRPLPRIVGEA
ncbi:hypothetical protein J7T55_015279 [Diaporthe amygdali]|uniref:uncharacterized protein n=1 Tax=Phomopsis amygdali TaxID=1214568 RepID=UPI0022FF0620|nr:uncharacterized protein J7T55_015279 [Diaporthe amygdali]KAJ0120550.1 hypothetical protein J7T55_015279 [Diaporthe amygdali]